MSDPIFDQPLTDQGRPQSLFDTVDPEIAETLLTRRSAILRGASTSAVVAAGLGLASAPVALAALARDAYGQTTRLPAVVIGVLNFALTLEYLESEFYTRGVASGIIPAADRAIFDTITRHEAEHVAYLRTTLGSSARAKPTFDYTAGGGTGTGPYAGVFSNYEIFKAVAQAFEDTGVRAYKGQAPALMPYKAVLTAALTIHSVEARHASEVRRLRGNFQENAPNKGWISGNQTDVPGTGAVYAGEENTVQGGVDVTSLTSAGALAVSESFDEPLTMAQVLAIVTPFIAA